MSVQHCLDFDRATPVTLPSSVADMFYSKRRLHLSPLVETLSLMDCAISMTEIPEAEQETSGDQGSTLDNLFNDDEEAHDPAGPSVNFLRSARRSPLQQSRIIALRRRAVRAKSARPAGVWPLPPVETIEELRAMRDKVFIEDPISSADELPSLPLRLATHAINVSLIATALPVGVAMMGYSLCKGEDIKFTARMTTLTGLALAVIAGNPQLASLVGA